MRIGSPMCKCNINQICKKYSKKKINFLFSEKIEELNVGLGFTK